MQSSLPFPFGGVSPDVAGEGLIGALFGEVGTTIRFCSGARTVYPGRAGALTGQGGGVARIEEGRV